jgi:hypothetical protein
MAPRLEGEGLLQQSLSLLRECGRGNRECVVIWLGPADDPGAVSRVVHPIHTGHRGGYQIDPGWLDELWVDLAEYDERIVAQVHTHPDRAFHSRTDDTYPITFQAGLYSLVIADFAKEPIDQNSWFLAELQPDATWEKRNWPQVAC